MKKKVIKGALTKSFSLSFNKIPFGKCKWIDPLPLKIEKNWFANNMVSSKY